MVAHHLHNFNRRLSHCNLVDMNLGHLLSGTNNYKFRLGVIDQKAVRKHPGTDVSNTVLDTPQRSILRHRWVWSKRQIDLGIVSVTV